MKVTSLSIPPFPTLSHPCLVSLSHSHSLALSSFSPKVKRAYLAPTSSCSPHFRIICLLSRFLDLLHFRVHARTYNHLPLHSEVLCTLPILILPSKPLNHSPTRLVTRTCHCYRPPLSWICLWCCSPTLSLGAPARYPLAPAQPTHPSTLFTSTCLLIHTPYCLRYAIFILI